MLDGHYYKSLTRNMVLTMIMVSLMPLILVSGAIGYWFETSYRSKVIAHLKELVQKHEQTIDLFLNEKLSYIRLMANSFSYEQLSDETFLQNKLSLLQQAYGGIFVDLGVVNEQGKQVAYAGMFKLENADYSGADWFKKAMQRPYCISDVFLGLRRQPHFIITVKQKWKEQDWILRATVDFHSFNELVENIRVGETGSAFILNREGELQTRVRHDQAYSKDLVLSLLSGETKMKPVISSVLAWPDQEVSLAQPLPSSHSGNNSHILAGYAAGHEMDIVYVMAPLKNGEWVLTFQQNFDDAFRDLYDARKVVALVVLIGGLAIFFTAFVLSHKTVRHIRRADSEKEMMNEQVIETGKMASIGELAAGIAHEINNPVAVMVEEAGWLDDLLEEEDFRDSKNLSEFQRALHQIRVQGVRCREITHKLLSFARKTDPHVREIQINELVTEVVEISEQKARYSSIKINRYFSPDLPIIHASPTELQQVLLNLINNAVDAIGTRGGNIDICTKNEEGQVVISVTDTGEGIPQAILGRIFDPFFTTKPVGKGTGLGLSICYGIVNKMGGSISVSSAVGIGTAFNVRIPVKPE